MPSPTPVLLLRTVIALAVLTGGGLLLWFIDQTMLHPWQRLQAELSFWIPFMITVVGGLAALVMLYRKASHRLERGEDLYNNRYWRRPSERS